jgi:hypothetical protein
VVTANGYEWRVYGLASDLDRGHTNSLIFDCGSVMRRVRDIPADWKTLDDTELVRLLNGG